MLVVPHFSPPMMIRFGRAAWRRRRLGTRPPRFRSAVKRSRARRHIASSEGSCVGGGMRGELMDTAATEAGMLAACYADICSSPMDVFRTPDERFEGLPGYDFEPHYTEVDGLRLHYVDEGPTTAGARSSASTASRPGPISTAGCSGRWSRPGIG